MNTVGGTIHVMIRIAYSHFIMNIATRSLFGHAIASGVPAPIYQSMLYPNRHLATLLLIIAIHTFLHK